MEPSMDLNSFPDVVLRAIFDRVPLLDLARHIPLVCHRWHALQPSVLLSKKIQALTIVVGPAVSPTGGGGSTVSILHGDELTNEDGSPMFPSPMDDPKVALTLTFTTLTSNRVDSMIGAFRNLSYLKITVRKDGPPVKDTETIPLIGRLLDHWAGLLKTLKFDCSLTYNEKSTFKENEGNPQMLTDVAVQWGQLIATVNTLPLLEHLTMDLNKDLRKATEPLELSILGRLKEFYFSYDYGQMNLLFGSLRRYAEPNRQLHSIGLGNQGMVDQYLEKFGYSSLAKRFTMLPNVGLDLWGIHTNVEERTRFLNTFSSQTVYTLTMKNLNLEGLTTTLAPLTRLVHLFLVGFEPFSNFDRDSVDQIRPLQSVKVLTLLAQPSNSTLHTEFASSHWCRILPNVQIIILFHDEQGCAICGFQEDASEPEILAPCVQRSLLSFKQQFQRTLKKVYYCHNRDFDNIKVFTPDTI